MLCCGANVVRLESCHSQQFKIILGHKIRKGITGSFPLTQRSASSLQREQCMAALWISGTEQVHAGGCELRVWNCSACTRRGVRKFANSQPQLLCLGAKALWSQEDTAPCKACHLSSTARSGSSTQHWSRICSGHSWRSQTPGIVNCNCSAGCGWQQWTWREFFPFINSVCSVLLKDSISLI